MVQLQLMAYALLTIQVVSAAEHFLICLKLKLKRVFSEKISAWYWLKFWQTKSSANDRQLFSQKILFIAAQQQKRLGSIYTVVHVKYIYLGELRQRHSSTKHREDT